MVYMLLGTGFEETEAIAPLDLLRRAGVEVKTVGLNGKVIYGSHNIGVEADLEIDQLDLTDLEMIILPGGLGGVASARACQPALDALKFAWENDKFVAAICAGPTILGEHGLLNGKRATCYPGCEEPLAGAIMKGAAVEVDGKFITGKGMGKTIEFALSILEELTDRETSEQIAKVTMFAD